MNSHADTSTPPGVVVLAERVPVVSQVFNLSLIDNRHYLKGSYIMDDLAELGLVIDTTQVSPAISKLDGLASSAEKAETGTQALSKAFTQGGVSIEEWNKRTQNFINSSNTATGSVKDMEAEIKQLNRETAALERETAKLNKETNQLTNELTGASTKSELFSRAMQALPPVIGTTTANLQLAKAAVLEFGAVLAPIALLAAGVGAGTGGIFYQMRTEAGDLTDSLDLTDKQLKRLKDSGTDTLLTLGDVYHGFIQTVEDRFTEAFEPQLAHAKTAYQEFLTYLFTSTVKDIADIVGSFSAGYNIISDTWSKLPDAFADIMAQVKNSIIHEIDTAINYSLDKLAYIANVANKLTGDVAVRARHVDNREANPFAGTADSVGRTVDRDIKAGMQYGRDATSSFINDAFGNAREIGLTRVNDAAGDPEKAAKAKKASVIKDPLDGVIEKGYGENAKLYDEFAKAQDKVYKSGQQLLDQSAYTEQRRGLDAKQLAELTVNYELHRKGIDQGTAAWLLYGQAIHDAAVKQGEMNLAADNAKDFASNMHDVAASVKSATASLGDLFGTVGKGFTDLINGQAEWIASQADAASKLADIRAKQGSDSDDYRDQVARNARANSEHELDSYSHIASGIKGLFKEKSAAYKLMETVEKAYAAVRTIHALEELLSIGTVTTAKVAGATAGIAADTAATGASVANSGIRAAADGVAAFAKTLASLPFPANLAAGAAVLAALVAVGGSIFGGKGGGGAAATGTTQAAPTDYTQQNSAYSTNDTGASHADNGGYGIDRTPRFVEASGKANAGNVGPALTIQHNTTINANGADDGTVEKIRDLLPAHQAETIAMTRQIVANDQAKANSRQRIGGN